MTAQFVKASKRQSKARIVITGPTGSGKTYSALSIASALGKRVAVIDTEQGSASLYSDQFDFDVLELTGDYHPQKYVEAIKSAASAGYDVCVVDSITHEWNGKGGVLPKSPAANIHRLERRTTRA
jgi:KaiC/GvpD/RAD55 family RecA-like ATPase